MVDINDRSGECVVMLMMKISGLICNCYLVKKDAFYYGQVNLEK